MAIYLVSYDLKETTPQPHAEFSNQCKALGWKRWVKLSNINKYYKLPNTTFRGSFPTMQAAKDSIETARLAAAREINGIVTITKLIVVEFSAFRIISDETTATPS